MAQTADEIQTQLLLRIAAQDRDALAEFYEQVAGLLFSVSFRILSDRHEAEEAIQDTFVQIWNKAAAFDAALGAPIQWALTIVRNRSIDRLRARQRRTRLTEELSAQGAAENLPASLGSPDFGEDEMGAIRGAVLNLPRDQRQAIEMAFFKGMSHQEIAAALAQPLGTIKARIRRGMLKLRETLEAAV